MLCEVPLTKEQQAFATAHHSLVYKFLNENRLPEDEFYDVVIFGYLKAAGIPTRYISTLNERDQLSRRVKILPLEVNVRTIVAGSMATR